VIANVAQYLPAKDQLQLGRELLRGARQAEAAAAELTRSVASLMTVLGSLRPEGQATTPAAVAAQVSSVVNLAVVQAAAAEADKSAAISTGRGSSHHWHHTARSAAKAMQLWCC